MKTLPCIVLAAALSMQVACAQTIEVRGDPMANLFGNTLTVISQNGHNHLWYNPDHTFTAMSEEGRRFAGTWELNGTILCSHVAGAPAPYCGDLGGVHEVGDHWQDERPDGGVSRLWLVPGRAREGSP